MTGEQSQLRPKPRDEYLSDAEREYYLGALASARESGRLDSVEYQRRTHAVADLRRQSDLEALVADIPRPPRPEPAPPRVSPGKRIAAWSIALAVAAGLGLGVGSIVNTIRDSVAATERGLVEQRPVAEADPVEEEIPATDMFAPGALAGALNELVADGLTEFSDLYVYPDSISLEALTAPGALTYDSVEILGPGRITRTPAGTEPPEWVDQYFTVDDFDPNAIAAIAAQAGDVADVPGRPVELITISADTIDGTIRIRAHLEDDAYGGTPSPEWDATGQHLIEVYS